MFLANDNELKVTKNVRRKVSDLKLAFSEFYLSLILLQNYQVCDENLFSLLLLTPMSINTHRCKSKKK